MRIRTIKPEFFTHEGIFEAEAQTGLPLRLAFIGLWCAADRAGRFQWQPRRLKVQILPYDDGVDFSRVLDALATRGFVVKYATESGDFGFIPGFERHQIVNNREKDSELPAPPESSLISNDFQRVPHACHTRQSRDSHAGTGEGKGREGKGKEGKGGACAPATATKASDSTSLLPEPPSAKTKKGAAAPLVQWDPAEGFIVAPDLFRQWEERFPSVVSIGAVISDAGLWYRSHGPKKDLAMFLLNWIKREAARWPATPLPAREATPSRPGSASSRLELPPQADAGPEESVWHPAYVALYGDDVPPPPWWTLADTVQREVLAKINGRAA